MHNIMLYHTEWIHDSTTPYIVAVQLSQGIIYIPKVDNSVGLLQLSYMRLVRICYI